MQRYGQPRRGNNDALVSGEVVKSAIPAIDSKVKDVIDAKDAEIAELNSTVADRDETISNQSEEINTLTQTVADRDASIVAKDEEIADLQAQLAECEATQTVAKTTTKKK